MNEACLPNFTPVATPECSKTRKKMSMSEDRDFKLGFRIRHSIKLRRRDGRRLEAVPIYP